MRRSKGDVVGKLIATIQLSRNSFTIVFEDGSYFTSVSSLPIKYEFSNMPEKIQKIEIEEKTVIIKFNNVSWIKWSRSDSE